MFDDFKPGDVTTVTLFKRWGQWDWAAADPQPEQRAEGPELNPDLYARNAATACRTHRWAQAWPCPDCERARRTTTEE